MAKQSPDALGKEIEALARANEKLKAENSSLKTELHHQQAFGRGWRLPVIGLSVALATAFLVVGNILFWAGDTLVNTGKYTETVSNVIEDEVVQDGIARYATAQLFANVDVPGVIQDALPPRASFLAAPLTTEVRQGTNKALERVLASDRFQSTFVRLNTKAHDTFIGAVKNSKSDGTINLQDVYNRLSQNLQDTKLSFLVGKPLPSNVGSIQIIEVEWLPKARAVINNIGWVKPVALFLTVAFSALAIWLSSHRRKLVITLGIFLAGGMLASLVSARLLTSVIVTRTAPEYQAAVDRAAHIIAQPFVTQTVTILALSLLVVAIAWVSGPYQAAVKVRGRIQLLLSGKLHQALFGHQETAFTRWLAIHKRLLQWLTVAVIGTIMLLVQLSPKLVTLYGLLILLIILIIETLAAPYSQRRR